MGRRSKNKQGPPQPLDSDSLSAGRTGKRKADDEGVSGVRPNKKLKDVSNKVKSKSLSKSKPTVPNGKGRPQEEKDEKKSKKKVQIQENEDGGAESTDGWEDVDDEIDLKAQARCICIESCITQEMLMPFRQVFVQ